MSPHCFYDASPQLAPELVDHAGDPRPTGVKEVCCYGLIYYPAVSESDCQLAESRSFLSRVYDGSLSKMVMGFVKNGNLSSDELHELKSLIEQQEKTDADTR